MDIMFTAVPPIEPQVAGEVGGDWQATDAFMRRYAAPLDGGRWAVIDKEVYVEDNRTDQAFEGERGRWLTVATSYTVCTDRSDPGGSELLADVHRERVTDGYGLRSTDVRLFCAGLSEDSWHWPQRLAWMLTTEQEN